MNNKIGTKLTLALIKPDASQTPQALQTIKAFLDGEKIRVVQHKFMKLSLEEAQKFYHEHRSKFFYNRLVSFMTSGPIHALILTHKDPVRKWRTLMGPTKVYRSYIEDPTSLRSIIGLSDTRNSTHGSDSEETARKEINFFFPDFNLVDWERKGRPSTTFSLILEKLNCLNKL